MDSSLIRAILATFGGFLLILLFLSVHDWFLEEYPRRPEEQTNSDLIQYPFHHQEAIETLRLFFAATTV